MKPSLCNMNAESAFIFPDLKLVNDRKKYKCQDFGFCILHLLAYYLYVVSLKPLTPQPIKTTPDIFIYVNLFLVTSIGILIYLLECDASKRKIQEVELISNDNKMAPSTLFILKERIII
jgi:hypothetical protein